MTPSADLEKSAVLNVILKLVKKQTVGFVILKSLVTPSVSVIASKMFSNFPIRSMRSLNAVAAIKALLTGKTLMVTT